MEFKLTVVAESGFWLYSRSLPTVPLPSGALSRKSITTDSFLNGQLGLLREVVELGCIIYTATFTFHEGRQPRVKVKSSG